MAFATGLKKSKAMNKLYFIKPAATDFKSGKFVVDHYLKSNAGKFVELNEDEDDLVTLSNTPIKIPAVHACFAVKITKRNWQKYLNEAIEHELFFARTKHPSSKFMVAALCEEAGETSQAMIDFSLGVAQSSRIKIIREAIQTIVVSRRLIEEGDADHKFQGVFS